MNRRLRHLTTIARAAGLPPAIAAATLDPGQEPEAE